MLKWFSSEEGEPASGAPGSPHGAGAVGGDATMAEVAERLAQTEQLVTQLKEMIRQKDLALCSREDQLKMEKEASETKMSKMRLQNKAKVTSLNAQLEELRKQQGGHGTPKKGAAEVGEQATRGKVVLLKKKVEECEQQNKQLQAELEDKRREVQTQQQRGEEMDGMLSDRDRRLAEKEAYIIHLQTALVGDQPASAASAPLQQAVEESGLCSPVSRGQAVEESAALQELQRLVQTLTRKVGEAEERYSLLEEQKHSLTELLSTEREQYQQKENMYKQSIQTFKDILLEKENTLMEVNQMHQQELFKLLAKSDASADLEQLLKALKQKLHEKEEVLLGKNQVIDVLQGEVDGRDQQIKEMMGRLQRLQVERESLESKMEAEKHVMRAQLRDLMEKQQAEVRRLTDEHQAQLAQSQQDLQGQLEEMRGSSTAMPVAPSSNQLVAGNGTMTTDPASIPRLAELEAQAKQKKEEASKSEAKFLKMKAWSKSRIRQLEEELRKSQAGGAPPELDALRSRITALEEDREESLWKLEQYEELKAKNDILEAKLVVYEEQQRTLQADLEQVTKRAASQASESGSAEDHQSQVLEWQEMVSEAVSSRDRAREEKAAMALRISHMEEEREVLVSRQQELEEELAQTQGLGQHRARKLVAPAQRSLQEDFEFDRQPAFQEPCSVSGSTAPIEGENMGGWWPEYSTPDPGGLRSVVEELELERNQLQEEILGLEERCQELEDRLQLQARIEALQNESERLQGQLANLRSQQSRDAEKHQLLVTSLNEQLRGLSDTQECLESSLIEKDNTLAQTSEKLELINSLRECLSEKESQFKDVGDKLLHAEHNLVEVSRKLSGFEKQCCELKAEVVDLTQKLSASKEKTQKQEVAIETLQTELDQTNDELDKLNTNNLEERAQLIHDLQSCEREIDGLKDILLDKEKEISTLSINMLEYTDRITALKQEVKLKEEDLVRTENALSKVEREAQIIRDSQDSDQQSLNIRITELLEQLKDAETQLIGAKEEKEFKVAEVEELTKHAGENRKIIQGLKEDLQKQIVSHHNHVSECETLISSLKEQMELSSLKFQEESEGIILQLHDKEQVFDRELKSLKEERNKLLADVSKHNDDMQTLSKQLEEQLERNEHLEKVTRENLEKIKHLEGQLKSDQEQACVERQAWESQNNNLGKELQSKSENILKLKNHLKNAKTEKQQLQGNLKKLTDELDSQKQSKEQLNEKLKSAAQLNSRLQDQLNCLTKENSRLQLQVDETTKSISDLKTERESLQTKVSTFEKLNSENSTIIQGLQKDNEELSVKTDELKRVLEQRSQSISETLLEKTNECNHLNQLLRNREEELTQLQETVQSVTSQVEGLQHDIQVKEQTVTDLRIEINIHQNQQNEQISLLQEQLSSLESRLMEKDALLEQKVDEHTTLQNEIVDSNGMISKLQVEGESLQIECTKLHQQIADHEEMLQNVTQERNKYKDDLVNKNGEVIALTNQLAVIEEKATELESEKAEIKASMVNVNTQNIELRKELEQWKVEVSGVSIHIQALTEQNHQLRAAYEIREKELALQIQVATELDGRNRGVLEQNSNLILKVNSLTAENLKLQEDMEQKIQTFSELTTERGLLQERISGLEMQHAENNKVIEGLLKKNEDLTLTTVELSNVLELNRQTHAEGVLVKMTECKNLSATLREKEEHAADLQDRCDSLATQLNHLNSSTNEKDKTLSEQSAHMEAQEAQILQLQDTLSLLQEQGSALKSGLMEKDTMCQKMAEECSAYQNELMLRKDLISKIQGEAEVLRDECSDLHLQMDEKEQCLRNITHDYENNKDELSKQNELMVSLSSQVANMDSDVHNLKAHIEKLSAENCKLIHEVDQRKTEVDDFRSNRQALDEHNAHLKSDLGRLLKDQSKLFEEITNLKMSVSEKEKQVSSLTEELKTACSIKDGLCLTVQEKETSLRQQEAFLQQLQAKSVEAEGQTSQQSLVITQLQTEMLNLQQCLQNKDALWQRSVKEQSLIQTEFTGEKEKLQSLIDLKLETIARLERELSESVEKNTQLCSRLAEQEAQLNLTVESNHSLGSQVLGFEESIVIVRSQVDTLTSESSVLKETLKEKENIIIDIQRTSAAAIENLNSKLVSKEVECETMKEQLSHIKESVTKLNDTLQVQMSEIATLKEAMKEKEALLRAQEKSLEDLLTKAEDASLFRSQFTESRELVSHLRSQIQLFSTESANRTKSEEEKQSAFTSLQEKCADLSAELKNARDQLTKSSDEVSNLSKSVGDSNIALQAAEGTVETLRNELSRTKEELQKAQELNSSLSKQKEEAFSRYQTNMSLLTMEMDSLKLQHIQVEAQMNVLTENLEQRELALHAINSQYTTQAKHTAHLVSEMQKLKEQNKSLHEGISLSREEHQIKLNSINNEKIYLQEQINKFVAEKEMLERRHVEQIQSTQEDLQLQMQQQSSSMNEILEKVMSEKEKLQAEVSVKVEEISVLKANINKVEQILQDSEKEWLLVLDRASKDKNLLLEQLKSVENEILSKDFKVNALKQDLDYLQEKLADASSAIRIGSEQLKAKELEASATRVQLEKILASVQEKDNENKHLIQALQDLKSEIQKLKTSKLDADKDASLSSQTMSERFAALAEDKVSLEVRLKVLQENHQSELEALRGELDRALVQLQKTEFTLKEGEKSHHETCQQIICLEVEVKNQRAQLHSESEKWKEAIVKHSSLDNELQVKNGQIDCMSIQISQQKELLAGLSQQLKDKDISIAQVIESASNERMKLAEENGGLQAQLESMKQVHASSVKKLENNSRQLEEHILLTQGEIKSKISENGELIKENERFKGEIGKQSKEKDAIKKKLQAALIARKDLLKKLERYEKEEKVNVENEVSVLQERLQEITSQAQATTKRYEEHILDIEKKIEDKERDIYTLEMERADLEKCFQMDKHNLQAALSEKADCLAETLHRLNEKTSLLTELQSSILEKENTFQHERLDLQQKIQDLQNELKRSEDILKEKHDFTVAFEKELAQLKQEKTILQKKAQAALIARKETVKKSQEKEKILVQELSELKDNYKVLFEQHGQQANALIDLQLKFDHQSNKMKEIHVVSLSGQDEGKRLRHLVEEGDKSLQNLTMSLAEEDSQGHSLSAVQSELETVQSNIETMSSEMTNEDRILGTLEQSPQELVLKLTMVKNDLQKANAKIKEQAEELEQLQQALQVVESRSQQDNQAFQNQLIISQNAIGEIQQSLNAITNEHKIVLEEKTVLLGQISKMKSDLHTAETAVSHKFLEIKHIQNKLAETQQQLNEEKDVLAKELEKAQLYSTENESSKLHMELLQQEKENAFRFVDKLREEVATLQSQLIEAKEHNKSLNQNIPITHEDNFQPDDICKEEVQSLRRFSEKLQARLKDRDDALFISQSLVAEKEELITTLEYQLQRQIHLHEMAMEKMRSQVDTLQKSEQDVTKDIDQENQSKAALLTRKLQAALFSRKELMRENTTLRGQVETMMVKCEENGAQSLALESTVSCLKQQNIDLENVVSSSGKEKDKLSAEVDRILSDNHNLSAACESLKLTIENITQQKQAFSCQLESLKDSQTDELSEWKSKHSELKHDYESLLQAYENVSSEIDKMRLLLEGARRERQDVLLKLHELQTESEVLVSQSREVEEENGRIKEKMRKFAKAKQKMIEELEKENQNIKQELIEYDKKQELKIDELTVKNLNLETEISRLQESTKELKVELTEIQTDNVKMSEELKEANCLAQKFQFESRSCENDMQFKLDEALNLNNLLTVQIQTQKTELSAQLQINDLLQKEKQSILSKIEEMENGHELHLGEKDNVIKGLKDIVTEYSQDMISLREKVRILEDDKSLLQEELENVQEISDKVKNENEYLETLLLKNSERIDELTESVNALHNQNMQLSLELGASKEKVAQVCQEKEQQQLRLVKELEEKLKTAQRGSVGSKNAKKELQELLREKHHEVNQLQQNCIKYQELFLDLERSCKASQFACEQLKKELKNSSEKRLDLEERNQHLSDELMTHKDHLLVAKESIASIQSEKEQLALEIAEKSEKYQHQVTEGTNAPDVNDQWQKMYIEQEAILQKRIDELQISKEQETQMFIELRRQMDSKDLEMGALRREADTNVAKVAALSSIPEGVDASKHWDDIFQSALHEKDNQLLEQGFMIKRFLEDTRAKEKEINELQMTKSKLERALNEYSVAATAHQRQLFVLGVSNTELTETGEIMNGHLKELKFQIERLEQDKSKLSRELADKGEVASQRQLCVQHLEKMSSDMEAQLLVLQSQKDHLQANFEKQETIALQLKMLLQNKDAEISSLLSCRDGQMSGYLEQLQANHRAQIDGYEDRVTSLYVERDKADKEMRRLENTAKSLQIKLDRSTQEKERMADKMESFRNSMIALQTERERLVSEYRMLEEKNNLVLRDIDGPVNGDLSATKGLKNEIRKLLHQMDDLNSENAMLRAQLVRYREDLNQVLSLKDNQLKELLKRQQDMIKNLEIQKASVEKQHRDSALDLQSEQELSNTLKVETSKLKTQVSMLESDLSALKKERTETNEGKVIADLQQAVAAKAVECNGVQQKLAAQKALTDELKNKLQQLESDTDKKLAEAKDKYNSGLGTFEREVDLMRNEQEMADRRVAELARDLLQTEQLLSEAKSESKNVMASNESLGKALAALQDDRDALIEDFKNLQQRYDKELRETRASLTKSERSLQEATSELAVSAEEKNILVHKMNALNSQNTQAELNNLVDKLSEALLEKEGQLRRVTLENDTFSKQVFAFSKSMASLQNDRDRLADELVGAKRVLESRQGSVPVLSSGLEESNRGRFEGFQNERDGLENELKVVDLQKCLEEAQACRQHTETELSSYQHQLAAMRSETTNLRSECQALKERWQAAEMKAKQPVKETVALVGDSSWEGTVNQLQAERMQLHSDLQRCLSEIQQRDQYYQQLNAKLHQAMEDKASLTTQLRAVSQTLRDTQDRCHWLESQGQSHTTQGSLCAEVAPGAPQERSSHSVTMEANQAVQLRERLLEVEETLSEERSRRETAEDALRHAEDRAKSPAGDVSIQLECEEEWEALVLNPKQPLLTRKVKGGMLACRHWLRGRRLYCSKLLNGRARSRYLFLGYLLTLHVVVLMCLTGAL